MPSTGVLGAQLVFVVLLLVVVAFGALAQRLRVPYPLVLFIAGLGIGFIPGLPKASLEPDVIFYVILPPLLYSGAWNIPWREFAHNLVSITSLAFGLVGFTVVGVAVAAGFIAPGFDWRIGFVLGAVVSPTDAIAATSIARNMGLPRRIVDVLEGESLVNDATGLLAVEMGVLLLTWGEPPPFAFIAFRLGYLIACGIAVGLLLGVVVDWFERRLDDAPIEIAISVLVPYAAYLIADALHASAVLAVVSAGLYLSRRSTYFFSPTVRLQAHAVWNALTFILNGLVFVLIGLQLPIVMAGVKQSGLTSMLGAGAALSAVVIALRLIWVFPGARLSFFIRRRLLRQDVTVPPARQLVIVGWAGMRGVIALAAAIALPRSLAGTPFGEKNAIVFFTFCVIVATLLFQGLTLPPLIRVLGLEKAAARDCEEREARRIMLEAALARLEEMRVSAGDGLADVYEDLAEHYRQRITSLSDPEGAGDPHRNQREMARELLRVEREAAIHLRDERRISDDVLRQLEHELDLREARLQPRR